MNEEISKHNPEEIFSWEENEIIADYLLDSVQEKIDQFGLRQKWTDYLVAEGVAMPFGQEDYEDPDYTEPEGPTRPITIDMIKKFILQNGILDELEINERLKVAFSSLASLRKNREKQSDWFQGRLEEARKMLKERIEQTKDKKD